MQLGVCEGKDIGGAERSSLGSKNVGARRYARALASRLCRGTQRFFQLALHPSPLPSHAFFIVQLFIFLRP